jgi:hypothetical protein
MPALDFYDEGTGLWTGARYQGPTEDVPANQPAGSVPMPACEFPHAMRLVDGTLVDYQPPRPDTEHEWNATERRWRKTAAAVQKDSEAERAKCTINDTLTTTVADLIEWALSVGGGKASALAALQAADTKIKNERKKLKP